jgi:hypothetical protein
VQQDGVIRHDEVAVGRGMKHDPRRLASDGGNRALSEHEHRAHGVVLPGLQDQLSRVELIRPLTTAALGLLEGDLLAA